GYTRDSTRRGPHRRARLRRSLSLGRAPTAVAPSETSKRPLRGRSEREQMPSTNSFGSRATLDVDGQRFTVYRLDALRQLRASTAETLPYSLKILLENLLRNEDDAFVKRGDIEAMATWNVKGRAEKEIAFRTSRVLLQDFTGVPAVVDLAAMRDAIVKLGGD